MQTFMYFFIAPMLVIGIFHSAESSWLCEEAASVKEGPFLTACGIGEAPAEDAARKKALENAFKELDLICQRSADCKDFELNIDPLRNDCKALGENFKCYRAIQAQITSKKKEKLEKNPNRQKDIVAKEKLQEERITRRHCGYPTEESLSLFSDLTSKTFIGNAVKAATTIPFRQACSRFHFQAMHRLSKAKVKSDTYNQFLLAEVKSTFDLSVDRKASTIFEFLSSYGSLSQRQWKVALETFERFPQRQLYTFTPSLFHTSDDSDKNQKRQKLRLEQVMKLVLKRKVGRPTPLEPAPAFVQVMRGLLSSSHSDHPWLALHAFDRYLKRVSRESAKEVKDIDFYLKKLFQALKSEKQKKQVITWMASNFAKSPANEKTADEMMKFVENLDREISQLDDEEDDDLKKIQSLQKLKKFFLEKNGDVFDKNFAASKNEFQKKQQIHFCLDHQLRCPQTVPGQAKLKKMLKSKKDRKRILALEILAKIKSSKKALEKEIFLCLQEANGEKGGKRSHQVVRSAIQALIAHGLEDRKKIDYILKLSWNRQFNYDDVLEALGASTLPSLTDVASDPRHSNQLTAIRMLGTLGAPAKKALPVLEKLTASEQYSVRDAAKASIEKIKASE